MNSDEKPRVNLTVAPELREKCRIGREPSTSIGLKLNAVADAEALVDCDNKRRTLIKAIDSFNEAQAGK